MLNFAIWPEQPSARCNFFNDAFAVTDVRYRLDPSERVAGCRRHAAYCIARVVDGKQLVRQPCLGGNSLRQEIATWRVMLMKGMNANAIDRCVARLGNRLPPGIMPLISDANPVHSHEHN